MRQYTSTYCFNVAENMNVRVVVLWTRAIPVWSEVYGLRHAALSEGYVSLQAVRRTLSKILYSPLGRTLRSRLHMKLRKLRESSRLW